jgi:hypothetical protein
VLAVVEGSPSITHLLFHPRPRNDTVNVVKGRLHLGKSIPLCRNVDELHEGSNAWFLVADHLPIAGERPSNRLVSQLAAGLDEQSCRHQGTDGGRLAKFDQHR